MNTCLTCKHFDYEFNPYSESPAALVCVIRGLHEAPWSRETFIDWMLEARTCVHYVTDLLPASSAEATR